ncbi:MAG: HEAT repeat domain-containing protein, partial [Anaerolineae bacterium]|nr:HEAT repeat domain-containing protein [Anaerolineae bacterium]
AAHAVEPLITALTNSDGFVRSYAATVLADIRDTRSITPLIAALDDPSDRVREQVIIALGSFGQDVLSPLMEVLNDPSEIIRDGVVSVLERLMLPESVAPLYSMLHDPSPQVQSHAVSALGWIGGTEAVDTLMSLLLDDTAPMVRIQVIATLGWLRERRTVEILIRCVKDEDEWVAYAAISALSEIGDDRAIPALQEIMATSTKPGVRRAARHALRTIQANLPDFTE